jgi:phosphatidylglycerophosphatase A
MTNRLALILATAGGAGYSPVAPGTAGSAVAVLIAFLLRHTLSPWHFAVLAVLLFAPAVWAADVTARIVKKIDPGLVVIDEVIGQWLTIAAVPSWSWKSLGLAFLLFRIFDIWKPVPVRQLEALPGGLGINADDAMAGIYGALVLWLAGWFNLIS